MSKMSVQHLHSVFGHRNVRIRLGILNETTVFSGSCSDMMHLVCFRGEFRLCLNFQPFALDVALSTEAAMKDERLNCDGRAGSCYSRTKGCVSLSLRTNSILHTAPLWLQSEGIPALSWESVRGGREELFHSKSPFVWGPLIGPLFENQGAKRGTWNLFFPIN